MISTSAIIVDNFLFKYAIACLVEDKPSFALQTSIYYSIGMQAG